MYSKDDYNGESSARDESDRRARMEAREDERDEEKAREAICLAEALNGWRKAVTLPHYAEIGNGLFVRVGNGRKRRAA